MRPIRTAESLRNAFNRSNGSFVHFIKKLDRQNIPYLSHSKVACIERCPRCYYRQYVLGQQKQFPAMLLGILFHRAAKSFYASYRDGLLPKPVELLKQFRAKAVSKESRTLLLNAFALLRANYWEGHEVIALEEPFFMDLDSRLPAIIGIPDLVMRRNDALVLIDHKTSKSFQDIDPDQLILYAEYLRRVHGTQAIVGVFDEYRMVPDLKVIKKPAFRRTPVSVDRSFLKPLCVRYRNAWEQILTIDRDRECEPSPSFDCWQCNYSHA